MTAINVICQNRHIHILSDGAHRDPEGKLVALGQKVFPLAALNSAIAVRGPSLFAFLLFTLIGSAGFDTGVDQMIDGLERTVRRANQHFDDWASKISDNHGADNHGSDNHVLEFELFVAGWSSKGGAESYFLANHPASVGHLLACCPTTTASHRFVLARQAVLCARLGAEPVTPCKLLNYKDKLRNSGPTHCVVGPPTSKSGAPVSGCTGAEKIKAAVARRRAHAIQA
jgi:hypothetical protein